MINLGQCEVKVKGKVTGHAVMAPPNHYPGGSAPDVSHGQSHTCSVSDSPD